MHSIWLIFLRALITHWVNSCKQKQHWKVSSSRPLKYNSLSQSHIFLHSSLESFSSVNCNCWLWKFKMRIIPCLEMTEWNSISFRTQHTVTKAHMPTRMDTGTTIIPRNSIPLVMQWKSLSQGLLGVSIVQSRFVASELHHFCSLHIRCALLCWLG